MEKELNKLLDDFWSKTFPLARDEWKEYVSKKLIKEDKKKVPCCNHPCCCNLPEELRIKFNEESKKYLENLNN